MPPAQPMLIELVEHPKASGDGLAKPKKADCPDSYGGIGVMTTSNGWYREITEVPAGYPAALAGIKVGDLLIDKTELLGKPGSVVQFAVDRKGEIIVFSITRAMVCVE